MGGAAHAAAGLGGGAAGAAALGGLHAGFGGDLGTVKWVPKMPEGAHVVTEVHLTAASDSVPVQAPDAVVV